MAKGCLQNYSISSDVLWDSKSVFASPQPTVTDVTQTVTTCASEVAQISSISIADNRNNYHTEDKSYPLSLTSKSNNKPYMDYRAITDTSSNQYALLLSSYTDDNGLVMIDGCYAVALGKWFGEVGSKYKVTFDNGNEICIIKVDEKQTAHTYENNDMYGFNGHIVEMLVDTDKLDDTARYTGNCDCIKAVSGTITKIERID